MNILFILSKQIVIFASKILSYLPQRYITFESLPDYSDNTRSIFNELCRRGLNKKYRFVWLCKNKNTVIPNKNVILAHGIFAKTYYRMRAKCVISCNTFVQSFNNRQKSIYLCHGIPLKSLNGYKAPTGIDYAIGLSDETNRIQSKELELPIENFISLGYPRNDDLSRLNHDDIIRIFKHDYKKVIVWYPTFRQHNSGKLCAEAANALPIIHDKNHAIILNEFAKTQDMLIVIKPHFSQDLSYILNLNLSNVLFINDQFFIENKISSYEFVGGCDALITDYSSIFYDYLLCNKPIAAIWEDIDEYKKNRGFAVDPDKYFKGSYKVYNINDLIAFLQEVSQNVDSLATERKQMTSIIHKFQDNHSSKRVADFIESIL